MKTIKTINKVTQRKQVVTGWTTQQVFLGLTLLLPLLAAGIGCGSGGGGGGEIIATPTPTPTPIIIASPGPQSKFTGRYVGTFIDATNSIDGNITFIVASDGSVTGSGKDSKTGQLDPFVGTIDDSGNLVVTVTLDTTPYTVKGTMAFGTGAQLSGNLNEFYGSTNVGAVAVNLVRN